MQCAYCVLTVMYVMYVVCLTRAITQDNSTGGGGKPQSSNFFVHLSGWVKRLSIKAVDVGVVL